MAQNENVNKAVRLESFIDQIRTRKETQLEEERRRLSLSMIRKFKNKKTNLIFCNKCKQTMNLGNRGSFALQDHVASRHLGLFTYFCTLCTFKAKWKSHTYEHMQRVHPIFRETCGYPKGIFSNTANLNHAEILKEIECSFESPLPV